MQLDRAQGFQYNPGTLTSEEETSGMGLERA